MDRRVELGKQLRRLLGSDNVYFQSPGPRKISYPAIRYALDGIDTHYADNVKYTTRRRYTVTLMDYDVDSPIVDKILSAFYHCSFDNFYVADNLNHWVFTVYY